MDKHPIEGLMTTTLESIRDMIDVNTGVGEPIATADGATVVPISRVSFGFVAGGGEMKPASTAAQPPEPPFAGGAGAGVTVQPLGFLVTGPDGVRLMPAQCQQTLDRLIELIPQTVADVKKAQKH